MKLFENVDKILAAFGNMKAMQRLHVDTVTENKIKSIIGEKIAKSSEDLGIWIEYQNLAGFDFLNVIVVSRVFHTKTFKGCKISFLGGKLDLILQSDTKEIESDFSNVSNRWITEMSFGVSKEEMKLINAKAFSQIKIEAKRKHDVFNVIK